MRTLDFGDEVILIKNLPAVMFSLVFCVSIASAKEWRGIIPLKSTKADVERLLEKPNQLGQYVIQNEIVSIWYSEGPCKSPHQGLVKPNCECLVAKDTVLRIAVTLDYPVKLSKLRIDKNKYQRTQIHAYETTATYANFTEGVVYTIRETDNTVTFIDYLPSAKDCDQIISSQTAAPSNTWLGLTPLRSTRVEVERLLGPSQSSIGEIYRYDTPDNRVDVSYATDPCKVNSTDLLATPANIVLKIAVTPQKTLLVRNLRLDKKKYIRVQNDHPENWVQYLNSEDGTTVEAMLNDGCEEVISIIYRPTQKDLETRCGARRRIQEFD